MSMASNYPVSLNYSTTLKPGDKVRPNQMEEFKNPYPSHLYIDEITFDVNPAVAIKLTGKAFKMRLKLDNRYVVEDFTPLTLLAPRTDISEDTSTTASVDNLSVTWKMPKPFWVARHENILIELFLDNVEIIAAGGNLNQRGLVNVCVKGRATKEVPRERCTPFVVHWRPAIWVGDASLMSGDENLKNSRAQEVTVTRMLSDFGTATTIGSTLYNTNGANINTGTLWLKMLLSHSSGYYLVKQQTPVAELFGGNRRNLDIRFKLKPLEFLTVQLEALKQAVPSGLSVELGIMYYGGFSVHGYSMEKVTLPGAN